MPSVQQEPSEVNPSNLQPDLPKSILARRVYALLQERGPLTARDIAAEVWGPSVFRAPWRHNVYMHICMARAYAERDGYTISNRRPFYFVLRSRPALALQDALRYVADAASDAQTHPTRDNLARLKAAWSLLTATLDTRVESEAA